MIPIETTTCYHCDSEATTREHAPPKCLFPKGQVWSNLITVPSCDKHNNANSNADEYLKFILGAIAEKIPDTITSGVARGVIRLAQKRSRNLDRFGLSWDSRTLIIGKDFPLDIELLRACLGKIARALYFYHSFGQRKLLCNLHILPFFVPTDSAGDPNFTSNVMRASAITDLDFERIIRLGSHQEIFSYQIIDGDWGIRINVEFYGAYRATIIGLVS